MKVAILSEGNADEAVVRVYVNALLGLETESTGLRYRRRANGGWKAVEDTLAATMTSLHYGTVAVGLVVVLDSDDEPAHDQPHDVAPDPKCRLCKVRSLAANTIKRLRPEGRVLPPLKLAFGLAVPCLEAWLLHRTDPKINERAWVTGRATGRPPFTRPHLKTRLYGSDRVGQEIQLARGVEEAAQVKDLEALIQAHPGFGALAADLRRWAT